MGKFLIIIGAMSICLGLALLYAPGLVKWFGHLPGDINIKTENTTLYIPITSMLLISIVITLIINLFSK